MSYGKPVLGQEIWVERDVRYGHPELSKEQVSKIGREYFYTGDGYHRKYRIEDWREVVDVGYAGQGHPSKEAVDYALKMRQIRSEVSGQFGAHYRSNRPIVRLTDDQYKQIHEIIYGKSTEQ